MSATTLSLPAVSATRSATALPARLAAWFAARLHEVQSGSDAAIDARRELAVEFSELSRGYPVGRSNPRWY